MLNEMKKKQKTRSRQPGKVKIWATLGSRSFLDVAGKPH